MPRNPYRLHPLAIHLLGVEMKHHPTEAIDRDVDMQDQDEDCLPLSESNLPVLNPQDDDTPF